MKLNERTKQQHQQQQPHVPAAGAGPAVCLSLRSSVVRQPPPPPPSRSQPPPASSQPPNVVHRVAAVGTTRRSADAWPTAESTRGQAGARGRACVPWSQRTHRTPLRRPLNLHATRRGRGCALVQSEVASGGRTRNGNRSVALSLALSLSLSLSLSRLGATGGCRGCCVALSPLLILCSALHFQLEILSKVFFFLFFFFFLLLLLLFVFSLFSFSSPPGEHGQRGQQRGARARAGRVDAGPGAGLVRGHLLRLGAGQRARRPCRLQRSL